VERLSDLAVFVCLALVFLGFVAQGYGILLIMAGLCVPVLVLLTSLFRERHLNLIAQSAWVRVAGLTPMVVKLAEGIEAAKKLLTFEVLVWGLFWGFAGWLCECLSLYILGGVVPHTPLFIGDAIGIYAAAIVVGAVSFFPGGLGTTEAAMVALLVNYGYNVQDAVMLTIVCRLLTLWVAVLLGWVAVGVLKLSRAGGVFMTLQSSTIGIAINVELPMISVVTVVFNGKDFIERTLKNVLAQDYPNIEYIVIDGGSTDGTLGIVSRYQSRLAYFSSELDCGIYDAMNKGIAVANGAWINFMNAGDEFWAVDTVSKSVNQINGVESILFGGVEIHYPGFFRTENAGAPDKLWQGMQFCHQSAFVSLSYHRANPFNKENKIAADLEFFYTAHQKGVMFKKLNQIVSRVITGGVSEKNRVRTLVASCIAICGSRSHPFIRIYYGIRIVDSILRAVTKMILPKKLVKKIILRKLCITRPPKC
jgi:glycosyltransferase involved in cell wall biosynthesis